MRHAIPAFLSCHWEYEVNNKLHHSACRQNAQIGFSNLCFFFSLLNLALFFFFSLLLIGTLHNRVQKPMLLSGEKDVCFTSELVASNCVNPPPKRDKDEVLGGMAETIKSNAR